MVGINIALSCLDVSGLGVIMSFIIKIGLIAAITI
jgi:hypothetical protein